MQCAKILSRQGAKILLVDCKTDLTKGIHTTGIFVRKTLEDFDFPPETLGKPVRDVALYSPKLRALNLSSEKDEFRVGKMGLLYDDFLQESVANGVQFARATKYLSSMSEPSAVADGLSLNEGSPMTIVKLEKKGESFEVRTKVLVGADGANSRVARDLALDENKEFIVGYEEVWHGVALEGEPKLHCFLDAKLAPGYLAWVTNDGEEVHIGVGGYPAGFNPREALKIFKAKMIGEIINLESANLAETRGGKIPVGGVLKRIASERGLLIGDASGAVSPLTAGGLDPCLRLSKMASEVIWERLQTENPQILMNYSGELFRSRFVSRLWMRRILAIFTNQTLLEIGCFLGRLPFLKRFVAHVFFGRGSFPDIDANELSVNATKTFDFGH